MQIYNIQNKIICPQISCIFFIIFHFISIFYFYNLHIYFVYYFVSYIFFDIIISFSIIKGINSKKFNYYSNGELISIIINTISSFIKLLFLFLIIFIRISFNGREDDTKYNKSEKYISFHLIIVIIIIYLCVDWILTLILFFYHNKVNNYCSNNIQAVILNNPLIQARFSKFKL